MTYQVVVAYEWRNVIVEVDADDPQSAHEIARWIVKNRKLRDAQVIAQGEALEPGADERSR